MKTDFRLMGLLILLGLVLLAVAFIQTTKQPPPPGGPMDNLPPLGHVPTHDQVENKPPSRK